MSATLMLDLAHEIPLARLRFDMIISNDIRHNSPVTPEQFLQLFMLGDGYWRFDPNSDPRTHAHAELTSGKHSNGYINCSKPLSYPPVAAICVAQLVYELKQRGCLMHSPTVTVGSGNAAITLGYEFGRQLGTRAVFTEKAAGKAKEMSRFDILDGDRVLMIEELITTLGTAEEQTDAIARAALGAYTYSPALPVLVNRSGKTTFQDRPIISLLSSEDLPELQFDVWPPDECELCQQGSVAVKPKGLENWCKLRGQS